MPVKKKRPIKPLLPIKKKKRRSLNPFAKVTAALATPKKKKKKPIKKTFKHVSR